jgi:hypothetical protein
MLSEMIGEIRHKSTGTRVLSNSNGNIAVEESFQSNGRSYKHVDRTDESKKKNGEKVNFIYNDVLLPDMTKIATRSTKTTILSLIIGISAVLITVLVVLPQPYNWIAGLAICGPLFASIMAYRTYKAEQKAIIHSYSTGTVPSYSEA